MKPAIQRTASLSGARILVAEDNDDIRDLLTFVLTGAGAQIEQARDGDEALRATEVGEFDVIVLDLLMPNVSGYEVFDRLRDAGLRTPVVAVTAHALKEDVERTRGLGFADLILKPFRTPELVAAVSRLVGPRMRVV